MKCPKCGGEKVLVEGLSNGDSRLICQECSYVEVKNPQGQKLILDERSHEPRRQILTECR